MSSRRSIASALLPSLVSLAMAACGGGGGGGGGAGAAAPTLASSAPAAGPGAGGTHLTLSGTGFSAGATVTVGGSAATAVTVVSASSITATTPAHAAGPVAVVVTNADGQSATLPDAFSYTAGTLAAAPKVTAFNILGAPPGGGNRLLIIGANLRSDSEVRFGGALASFVSFTPGQLTVNVPPSPLLPAVTDGFVNVVVQNPDGQSDTLAAKVARDGTPWPANFHYGPPPVATGFSPTTGKGLDVTISGTGFSADASGVRAGLQVLMSGATTLIPPFSATAAAPTPTAVAVAVPANQINPGNYVFIVNNFDGQSSTAPGVFVVP